MRFSVESLFFSYIHFARGKVLFIGRSSSYNVFAGRKDGRYPNVSLTKAFFRPHGNDDRTPRRAFGNRQDSGRSLPTHPQKARRKVIDSRERKNASV